ncbi:Ff.00g089970.m01.CDS01 [Fusarium sp. VM40]|nr:Ff.00g089970.m01.CDS01 [Fusarium sp. VM40]
MKLHQVTAVLAFIATGAIASPAGIADKDYNNSPEKNGNDYLPKKGGEKHDGDDDYTSKGYGGKGHGDKGKKFEWDIERCDSCPYSSKSWPEPKGSYGKGYKRTCPEDKKKCQKYAYDYSKATYSGYASQNLKCSEGDHYRVAAKIGSCGGYSKEQCLNVVYEDWDKYSDKIAFLGLYTYKKEGIENKKYLNFNKYCKKNECHVPVEKVPGYPKFKDNVWVGIDAGQCREPKPKWGGYDGKKGGKGDEDEKYGSNKGYKGDDEDDYKPKKGGKGDYDDDKKHESRGLGFSGRDKVKFIELDIEAKYSKKCAEFCCCT